MVGSVKEMIAKISNNRQLLIEAVDVARSGVQDALRDGGSSKLLATLVVELSKAEEALNEYEADLKSHGLELSPVQRVVNEAVSLDNQSRQKFTEAGVTGPNIPSWEGCRVTREYLERLAKANPGREFRLQEITTAMASGINGYRKTPSCVCNVINGGGNYKPSPFWSSTQFGYYKSLA